MAYYWPSCTSVEIRIAAVDVRFHSMVALEVGANADGILLVITKFFPDMVVDFITFAFAM